MTVYAPQLLQLPPNALKVGQVLVFDWHDGPREGFLRMDNPLSCWHYRLYAEARREEGTDDKLYLFSPAPDDSLQRLTEALIDLKPPAGPLWVPIWRFPSDEAQRAADQAVGTVSAEVEEPVLLVRSSNLLKLEELWLLVP